LLRRSWFFIPEGGREDTNKSEIWKPAKNPCHRCDGGVESVWFSSFF
jgi:hypothetical protein